MPSVPSDSNVEFTASDVLSTDVWSGKLSPAVVGIDVACTKIAVDLQNLSRDSADATIQRNLQHLVELTISDCAFLAMIGEDQKFGLVQVARRGMAHCQPEALTGDPLADYPWLNSRLEHLRLTELRDTGAPAAAQGTEGRRFAALQMGSLLMVVFRIQNQPAGLLALARAMPQGPWDVNLQLLLKLVGTSVASGLDRLRMGQRLAKVEERLQLTQAAANDGVWDFDLENNEVYFSPRWKAMLGYADEDMRGLTSTDACCAWSALNSTSPSASCTRRRCSGKRRARRSRCSPSATVWSPPTPTPPSTTSIRSP